MTVYKNDDVLFGKIEYRKQMVPYGEFFLKDAIDVVPDDEVKIIGSFPLVLLLKLTMLLSGICLLSKMVMILEVI